MAEKEIKDLSNVGVSDDKKATEYDLVTALLAAADFRNDSGLATEIDIRRGGKALFSFKIRPLGDKETKEARKKATRYMKNPNNAKLPPIEKEVDQALHFSWLIYLATVEEDRARIWGNKAILEKFDLTEPVEAVDILLRSGEKMKVVEAVMKVSGMAEDEDEITPEDYAKN